MGIFLCFQQPMITFKTIILILLLTYSCSYNSYGVHEQNMKVLNNTMIKNDVYMKKNMTRLRKQGVRSYSTNDKSYKKKYRKIIF